MDALVDERADTGSLHRAPDDVLDDPEVRARVERALIKVREGRLERGKDPEAVARLVRGLDARPRV